MASEAVIVEFLELCDKFRAYHSDPVNLALHTITTPLAVAVVMSAMSKASRTLGPKGVWVAAINAAYLLNMAMSMPPVIFGITAAVMLLLVWVSERATSLPWRAHALLFCVGYFGQDVSHWATGESTFQSSYQSGENGEDLTMTADFWSQLLEHTYYLIPLVIDALFPLSSSLRRTAAIIPPDLFGGAAGALASAAVAGLAIALVKASLGESLPPGMAKYGRYVVPNANALNLLVSDGNLDEVRRMLDRGADPSKAGTDGTTPLMAAVFEGRVRMVRELAARGADLDAADPDAGATAFHTACIANQPECAAVLVELGCDTELKAMDGRTGKQGAQGEGHKEVLMRLKEALKLRHAQRAAAESFLKGLE